MYLVCDDEHSVTLAYLAHHPQFICRPYTPCGVMGVAEYKGFHRRVCTLSFKVGKVYTICWLCHAIAIIIQKSIVGYGTLIVAYAREEAVIHWCLHKHLVTWYCQRLDDCRYRGHYP